MKSNKLGKVDKPKEQEDVLGSLYTMVMKEAQAKKANPSQLYLLGSYCQMAANEMALSMAMNSFGNAIKSHADMSRAEKEQAKRQQEQAEGKVRVKPE